MDPIAKLAIDVEARLAKFEQDMGKAARIIEQQLDKSRRQAERQTKAIEQSMEKVAGSIGNQLRDSFRDLLPAASVGAVVAGLGSITKKAIDTGDSFARMSQQTGLSTKELSGLSYALALNDTSLEASQQSLGKFARTAAGAAAGVQADREAFKALGISVTDATGKLKPIDKLLDEVADKFAKSADGTGKMAAATTLFSRSGLALIPVLNQGSKGLAELKAEAAALGYDLSGIAEKSDLFNDNLTRLSHAAVGLGADIARELLPAMIETEQLMLSIIRTGRESGAIQGFAHVIAEVVKNLDAIVVYAASRFTIAGIISGINALAASAGFASTALGVLRGGLAVLGGPAGAIALVAGALYLWEKGARAARDGTDELEKAQRALTGVTEDAIRAGIIQAAQLKTEASLKLVAAESTLRQLEAEQKLAEEREKAARGTASGALMFARSGVASAGQGTSPDAARAAVQSQLADIKALRGNIDSLDAAILKASNDLKNFGKGGSSGDKPEIPLLNTADASRAAASALKTLEDQARKAAGELGPLAKINRDYEQGMSDLADAVDKARDAGVKEAEITRLVDETMASLEERRQNQIRLLEDQNDIVGQYVEKLEEQTRVLVLDDRERAVQVALLEAERKARQQASRNLEEYTGLTEEATETIRAQTEAYYDQAKSLEAARQLHDGFINAVTGGLDDALRATLDFTARGFKGFSEFWHRVVDGFKSMLLEIAFMIARQRFVIPFAAQILGVSPQSLGGVTGGFGGVGGGNGLLGSFMGLFGAGGTTVGSATTATGQFIGAGSLGYGQTGTFGNTLFGAGGDAAGAGATGSTLAGAAGAGLGIVGGLSLFQQGYQQRNPWIAGAGGALAAYSGISLAASGVLGGALAGAAAGSVVPIVGTIIGFAVGAIITYFRSKPKPPEIEVAGALGSIGREEAVGSSAFGAIRVNTVGTGQVPSNDVLNAIKQFDDQLASFMTDSQIEAATARLATFDIDLKKGAATIENVLSQRFDAVLSTFSEDVQQFVNEATALEDRVARLADAVTIERGFESLGLDVTFSQLLSIMEDLKVEGESSVQAVARIASSVNVLGSAFRTMGITIDRAGEDLIRFAVEFTTAAGGVENATALWNRYFQVFYSPAELAQKVYDDAVKKRDEALQSIGVDAGISKEAFRQLFEAAVPTLTPEQIVDWLAAGAAIGAVDDALTQLNQAAGVVTEDLDAMAQQAARNHQDLVALIDDAVWDDYLAGLDEQERRIAEVQHYWDGLIKRATDLGASERELTVLRQLEADAIARVTDEVEDMIAALDPRGSIYQPVEPQDLSGRDRAIDGIIQFLNSSLLDESISNLTPTQRLAQARKVFDETLASARRGDEDALSALPNVARTLEEIARMYFASGAGFDDTVEYVRDGLSRVVRRFAPDRMDELVNVAAQYLPAMTTWLETISDQLGSMNVVQGSFADGTGYVASDMVAQLHRGEMVVDARTNSDLKKYGFSVSEKVPRDESLPILREMAMLQSQANERQARRDEAMSRSLDELRREVGRSR